MMLDNPKWKWLPDDQEQMYGCILNRIETVNHNDWNKSLVVSFVQIPLGFVHYMHNLFRLKPGDEVIRLRVRIEDSRYHLEFVIEGRITHWISLFYWTASNVPRWVCS